MTIQSVVHLLATSTNVTAGHFSRRFPRTRWQRPLSTSLARLLPRGRGLKTCLQDASFSNHLELSARCPQVGCVFISASIDVWPVDPVSDLVQLLPEDILHLRAEHFCLTFFTSSEGHTSSLAKKGSEQSSYMSSFPEMITFTLQGFEHDGGCRV